MIAADQNTDTSTTFAKTKSEKAFRTFGIYTIVAVYILILVGGIVRATGSGMGCPDWPRCFGKIIPPTDVSQLPADYKTRFAVKGKEIADFNVVHTWTEYLNRILGVIIGFCIFITMVLSFPFWKINRTITFLSVGTLLLVMFQGWLGSVVVATDLLPLMITLHMLVALIIVFMLMYCVVLSWHITEPQSHLVRNSSTLMWLLVAGMLLMMIQIGLGIQVRQGVDVLNKLYQGTQREVWLDAIGLEFYIHRSFSIVVLLLHGVLLRMMFNNTKSVLFRKFAVGMLVCIIGEIGTGIIMAYGEIPAYAQPIHLLLSSVIIGIEFMMILHLRPNIFLGKKQTDSLIFDSNNVVT